MSQDKIYLVAALGLSKSEMRFIKIMLALTSQASTSRTKGRYEFTEELSRAHIVIVTTDDDAIWEWHQMAARPSPPTLLLVTATEKIPNAKYYFSRPFGPAKVLLLLDKIVSEFSAVRSEPGIFSGAINSANRKTLVQSQGGGNNSPRALVIDDSPTVRKQLILELATFNIRVDTAETGEQGLEALKKNRYDIIFLDVVMPGVDGYQVCVSIRRNKETKLTPVVMLTSKSSPFDKVRGSLAGCSAYLTKPVEYENFYQVLEKLLTRPKDAELSKENDEYLG